MGIIIVKLQFERFICQAFFSEIQTQNIGRHWWWNSALRLCFLLLCSRQIDLEKLQRQHALIREHKRRRKCYKILNWILITCLFWQTFETIYVNAHILLCIELNNLSFNTFKEMGFVVVWWFGLHSLANLVESRSDIREEQYIWLCHIILEPWAIFLLHNIDINWEEVLIHEVPEEWHPKLLFGMKLNSYDVIWCLPVNFLLESIFEYELECHWAVDIVLKEELRLKWHQPLISDAGDVHYHIYYVQNIGEVISFAFLKRVSLRWQKRVAEHSVVLDWYLRDPVSTLDLKVD